MKAGTAAVQFSTAHPRIVTLLMAGLAVLLAGLAALPSLWPDTFRALHGVKVDTDPENMLSEDEAVRVFHDEMKTLLGLHDMVVVGVVNDAHPAGVFNPESLAAIHELTQYAMTLRGEAIGHADPLAGVVEVDVIAPSTVDNIEQAGVGTVRFEWLMPRAPATQEEAEAIRDKALRIPFLNGTLVSEDGKALALYLPLTSKALSARVYDHLRAKIAEFDGAERYYITGLPVAEDVFGVEMFKQMAVSAPLAMLVIFALMLVFFRKLVLILSPLIIAIVTVMCTMGLLVITGNTIHIMSSMIPIFIMPIAVLDSVHILSEFFDRYQTTRDRRRTVHAVMDSLFVPMLYTSLTSAAGFASLALTPIPPVQVFGIFVAIGIMLAWVLTITFVPAYIMFIPERRLASFGAQHADTGHEAAHTATLVGRLLQRTGVFTYRRRGLILSLTVVAAAVAVYGITRIQINDNPIKWFRPAHPIRVADRVLNEHFGGTYMAYLALSPGEDGAGVTGYPEALRARLETFRAGLVADLPEINAAAAALDQQVQALPADSKEGLLAQLNAFVEQQLAVSEDDTAYAWEEVQVFLDQERAMDQVFRQPEALAYIGELQEALLQTGVVGKSNSLTDIVKTVYRELLSGAPEDFRLPDTANGVSQTLLQYQSSHRPGDLWHFVTPDYRTSSVWVQLTSGDNRDMSRVVAAIDAYVADNPPPFALEHSWFGLTYINVVWQEKMVAGMLQSFLGSFLVVLLMMTLLFRSGLWGLLSMIPLTLTIGLIYGVIGLAGKDYDMPVAVLSSLTLGLAVDFAIHFLARSRELVATHGSWEAAHVHVFGEPARAITRNVIVIAVGFTPLLAAPLMPYKTVGVLLGAILLVSGASTLLLLPALMRLLEPLLFPKTRRCCVTCQCGTCIVSAVLAVALVAVNVHQFLELGWTRLTIVSLAVIPVLAAVCTAMSRRERCRQKIETL